MEILPDELLSKIFIRLNAKQLAQMRTISKSWNALLSQPFFIKSHLRRSINTNDQILLFFKRNVEPLLSVKTTQSPSLELTNFIKLPVNPKSKDTHGIRFIGSVNGLVCSSYDKNSVIQIWNPSIGAVLTLPPYSTPLNPIKPYHIHFRFGYDAKADDYKLVKLIGLTRSKCYIVECWMEIEIYSMRKGTWELITESFPSKVAGIMDRDYVCVDGRDGYVHWLGYTTNMYYQEMVLIAFDLGSETLREIPLPHPTRDPTFSKVFGILAGKLCLLSSTIRNDVYEMWVMEEYGVAESWVKRHVFSDFSVYIFVVGFTSHELLFQDQGNLVLYDPSANQQKVMEDYLREICNGVDKIVEYVDSLVWVAPHEHDKVEI